MRMLDNPKSVGAGVIKIAAVVHLKRSQICIYYWHVEVLALLGLGLGLGLGLEVLVYSA
jgi:hypothetical protein